MKNLNELVVTYKKTKDQKILEQILKSLNKLLHEKAKYIYYKQKFPLSYLNQCQYCKKCEFNHALSHRLAELKRREHCDECKYCTCIKGVFNLHNNNCCSLEDVEQDLILFVLTLIEKFDSSQDFNKYFINSVWHWMPDWVTSDYIKTLSHANIYSDENADHETTEIHLEDKNTELPFAAEEKKEQFTLTVKEILSQCKDKIDKKIVKCFMENPEATQEEIATKINISKQAINIRIKTLRKLLKNFKNID
jgi:RNA polymerase sigma factor (sigma-70 family)